MIEQVNDSFITYEEWNAVGKNDETTGAKVAQICVSSQVLEDTVQNV